MSVIMQVDDAKLKRWRDERCWSQEHLAETAGVSLRTVQRLERGESVSRETVMALAAAFDVGVEALMIDPLETAREADEKRRRSMKEQAQLAFWIHLATYIGVIGLLLAIDRTDAHATFWVTWPAIGWGVGVFAHGAAVLISSFAGGDR
ncbi:MAG: helix-turn-helix domain-containing protein [Pseudomonadota bacterium]